MKVGVPKEIKTHENRVALLPVGVRRLKQEGHNVLIEKGAGSRSGFSDEQYEKEGATIIQGADELWSSAEMILKVKEPVEPEYSRMKKGQIIFAYFHFAAEERLTRAVIESGAIAIAYETVANKDGSLPLLIPMSEVAGRMAPQEGARCLEKPVGGRGVLMGGIPGVTPARVMILGGGVVGVNAAKVAAGMGADVSILDINLTKLRYLDDVMPKNVRTRYSNETTIRQMLPEIDMIIGAILIPGARARHMIRRDMFVHMKPGSVMVDVAIDQGGCFETSRPTTHDKPTFDVDGMIHYCVGNMPGAVPYTSTLGLTNATLPYALELAGKGWQRAVSENPELLQGLSIVDGHVVSRPVAESFDIPWISPEKVL